MSIQTDLQQAINILSSGDYSLVVVKDGQNVVTAQAPGLKPLVEAIRLHGDQLPGAVLADKVIGRAAALLALHAGLIGVYGQLMSETAIGELDAAQVTHQAGQQVPAILNRDRSGSCPMEMKAQACATPAEAWQVFSEFFAGK